MDRDDIGERFDHRIVLALHSRRPKPLNIVETFKTMTGRRGRWDSALAEFKRAQTRLPEMFPGWQAQFVKTDLQGRPFVGSGNPWLRARCVPDGHEDDYEVVNPATI